ncbi:MAG: cysteine desulfurase NifS [Patescibacteria group bacterium]|nr:cysteine desulfurase NifS [Patescibacteria group bacterium]MDD5121176.1 cysteine desulfurase NifS [Patescibacteria group bacterium]MDD5222014.1 cysteine desulfurase NifS [Patescibacteria group bacterium]MDD5395905.1 cysteine desulfurase NifS [Patescibacteria group bacterium]
MPKRIYLDFAATTPLDKRVFEAMKPYFGDVFGNPFSLHQFGQEARAAIESARARVADLIGAQSTEIIFTSGGTEANNFAIKGAAHTLGQKGKRIITTAIEHHAVLNPCKFLASQGYEIIYLKPDQQGIINAEELKKVLNEETILVSVMHANNEMGAIQPIKEIAEVIKKFKGNKNYPFFHVDAVQTVGHLPIDVKDVEVDFLSMSAHKFYGPKGVGALYIKKGIKIEPLLHGGEQERGQRASTENTPGIVGFGRAAELAKKEMNTENQKLIELRDYFIKEIIKKIKDVILVGHPAKRLPNNVNLSFSGVEGEGMLLSLDLVGVACSTGSACSSNTLEPSHVVLAMGLGHEVAHSSLRFSLGKQTNKKELDYTINQLIKIVDKLRKMSPLVK